MQNKASDYKQLEATERKQSEEAIRISEEKYHKLFTNMADGFAYCQMLFENEKPKDFIYLEVNNSFERLTGLKKEKVLGKKVSEAIPGTLEANPELIETYGRVSLTGKEERFEVFFKPLSAWFSITVYSLQKGYFTALFENITERKITEEALQRQAALIDLSPDAIIIRSLDGRINFWSKGAEKLYGWTKEEAVGKTTHDLFKTKFGEPFEDIIHKLKVEKRWTGELIHQTKSGQEVTVQSWWLAEKTEKGTITSILESNVDLTERKQAEREITRLASFPTLNPDPVIEINFVGVLTYINPATNLLFPDLETLGLSHPFFNDWSNIIKIFEGHCSQSFGREIKISGHWYHQQLYLVPHTDLIRIYTTDVDELKKSEEAQARAQVKLEENAVLLEEYASQMEELAEQRAQQLQNSERMAAIGQTAGMVGHDIRNPLQAITGDMYLISEEIKDLPEGERKESIKESIQSINDNILYINKIVSDLQDYTRPIKPCFQNANLSELLEGALLTINIPKTIELSTEITEDAKPIMTDVAYLRRILTNIITNGLQAMQDQSEGKLTVKASRKKNNIIITVQDTGLGIPEEVRTKLFTPLFTTKAKGQGLGLAVVKRLVEGLGGTIQFESEANKGTKFTIVLPEPKEP